MRLSSKLEIYANNTLAAEHNKVGAYMPRMQHAIEYFFFKTHKQHEMLEKSIALADPKRILSMGYSITLHNGKVVKDAAMLKQGDVLTTSFLNGAVESTVK